MKKLPKFENAIALQDFRPINLMNTDAKIFAHVICKRFQRPLQSCKKNHQHACLPGRQMRTAIRRLKKLLLHNNWLTEVHVQ